MADVTNQGKEEMDTHEGHSSSAPVTAESVSEGVPEPSILVKTCQCLESNEKVLTEAAKVHITSTTVKYSYTGHPRIELHHLGVGLSPGSLIIKHYLLCLTEGTMLIMPA